MTDTDMDRQDVEDSLRKSLIKYGSLYTPLLVSAVGKNGKSESFAYIASMNVPFKEYMKLNRQLVNELFGR
jgi:hypothetical protein